MPDLPPTGGDPCSQANVINDRGQVVGADSVCGGPNLNAMLWQNGSSFDLNSLIAPTALHLNEAFFIAATGEIACLGTLPNGDMHVALLTPVAADAGGRFARASRAHATATESMPARTTPDPFEPATTRWDRIPLIARMRLR